MAFLFENNAISTLAAGIGAGDTSLTVQGGDGNLFPSPSGGDSFRATLVDSANNIEIVDCTSRTGDAITIARAQEGTSAQSYLAGDAFELRLTKETLATYRQGNADGVTAIGVNTSLGLADRHQFFECTSPITVTLPDAGTVGKGYQVTVKNNSSGQCTIGRATGSDTIDNIVGDLTLAAGDAVYISTNETLNGYITMFDALERTYPVGAIFFSTVLTNPAILLGFGTWSSIEGQFLVGIGTGGGKTYAPAETGGDKDAVVVEHNHSISQTPHSHGLRGAGNDDDGGPRPPGGNNNGVLQNTQTANADITIDNEGVVGTDLNLPPYLAVYIWTRTA